MSFAETQQVAARHFAAWAAGDAEAIGADLHPDAVLISAFGALAGPEAITAFYREVFAKYFPDDARRDVTIGAPTIEGDVAFVEWSGGPATYAVDTIVVRDGKKYAMTFGAVFAS